MGNRVVKFRGKRVDNGKWVYGYYQELVDSVNHLYWINEPNGDITDVVPETVGQYTGLKDRDGVEIYEGDVLIFDGYKFVILWNEERGGFHMDYWMFDEQYDLSEFSQTSEIISNIHDDPELMEGEK